MADQFKIHLFPKEDHFFLVLILYGVLVSSNFNTAGANETDLIPITVPKTYFIDKIFENYGRNQSPSDMTYTQFDKLYKKFLSLNNEVINTESAHLIDEKNEDNHDDHHDHDHHKRRKRSVAISPDDSLSLCFDADDLFDIFDLDINDSVNASTFKELCPAFLEQAGKHCVSTSNNKAQLWLLSFLASTVINIVSGICVVYFPRHNVKWYPYFHVFLLSMGISVMVCDALLHLFPHAVGLHFGKASKKSESSLNSGSYLWKSIVCLIGLFTFILVEMILLAFYDRYHTHSMDERLRKGTFTSHLTIAQSNFRISPSHSTVKRRRTISEKGEKNENQGNGINVNAEMVGFRKKIRNVLPDLFATLFRKEKMDEDIVLDTVEGPSGVKRDATKKKKGFLINISSVAGEVWRIQLADMVHNMIDGIVLGVSFTDSHSLHAGVSTAIAILLHEIPHEMADFDVSLQHGLSAQQALFLNFISALFAYFGMILGVSLNMYMANSTPWTFGLSSGLFIYISLICMLPELKSNSIIKTNPFKAIILDIVGLLVGAVIMVFLSGIAESFEDLL